MSTDIAPGHSQNDRRLQANQRGSWTMLLHYNQSTCNEDDIKRQAAELMCLLDTPPVLRIADSNGLVLAYWSASAGWHSPGQRTS